VDERLTTAYDYELPASLIAQTPAASRDASRLMVVRGDALEDRVFSELPDLLHPGDVLVLNETRVIPARLQAVRQTGGRVEVLLCEPKHMQRETPAIERSASHRWLALLRPSKRIREGERLRFLAGEDELGFAIVGERVEEGMRAIELHLSLPHDAFLQRAGRLPLPPYIHNESDEAQRRYQTVFARIPGSIAAPTAALHFTPELLDAVQNRGIEIAKIALHVGIGTFAPVRTELVDDHRMHSERYRVPQNAADCIGRAQKEGRRIVAVGTTVVRALEGCVAERGALQPGEGSTSLFITPGFQFRAVDAMITNFHLPRSTLLMLVSAFAGRDRILRAYRAAIERRYRFFSFGDAMLLDVGRST
jgi:S-adenosylmethionine:tRNA ribosyltransferase-isomerase